MSSYSTVAVESLHQAAELIKQSNHTVVLTGAGLSTPSGIPDFRSPGSGLWTRYSPMEVASLSAFRYSPENFYTWLHPLAVHIFSAQPNPAHIALAELLDKGYVSTIITQNIDGLLGRCGAKNVLEIHGTLNSLTCVNCFQTVDSGEIIQDYLDNLVIPRCPVCSGILKPDIILFEEQLPYKTWQKAENASRNCDLMIVAGTSLEVLPCAKLPVLALENGASLVIVNNSETFLDIRANIIFRADVAEIIPQILGEVLNA